MLPGKNLVLINHSENEAENPGKEIRSRIKIPRVDRERNHHSSDFNYANQLLLINSKNLEIFELPFKIARKIFKKRYTMALQETFSMDFIGAAQSQRKPAIKYLSSDEPDHIDCISSGSVDALVSSSDEETEEIQLIGRCVESSWPTLYRYQPLGPLTRKRGARHRGQADRRSPHFAKGISTLEMETAR